VRRQAIGIGSTWAILLAFVDRQKDKQGRQAAFRKLRLQDRKVAAGAEISLAERTTAAAVRRHVATGHRNGQRRKEQCDAWRRDLSTA
jgi:hypothetical protein